MTLIRSFLAAALLFAAPAIPAMAAEVNETDLVQAAAREAELAQQVTDLQNQLAAAKAERDAKAAELAAKQKESAANSAAFDCARKPPAQRPICYLKLVENHPGTAVVQDAVAMVQKALEEAGEKPTSALEKLALPGPTSGPGYDYTFGHGTPPNYGTLPSRPNKRAVRGRSCNCRR